MNVTVVALSIVLFSVAGAKSDLANGKIVFRKCQACHSVATAENGVGPSLKGVVNREAGTYPRYRYSVAMATLGVRWTRTNLRSFLKSPRTFVPGNKMVFAGLADPADVEDVIDYIDSHGSTRHVASFRSDRDLERRLAAYRLAVGGVTVEATGYVAECRRAGVKAFGPFPTRHGKGGDRIFGVHAPDDVNGGLGLIAQPTKALKLRGDDGRIPGRAAGIDNRSYHRPKRSPSKFEFIQLAFSRPIDVRGVQIRSAGGDADVWVATHRTRPNWTGGFAAAAERAAVVHDYRSASGSKTIAVERRGVRYVTIGAPPPCRTPHIRRNDRRTDRFTLESITFSKP